MTASPPSTARDFFGKYRGVVTENLDPECLGRVQVMVPQVMGSTTMGWAMPCVPYAGPLVGFYAIPPIGANVWVEFEGGKADYPIWAGCFWGVGEAPETGSYQPSGKVFQTQSVSVVVNDMDGEGGVTLRCGPPAVATPVAITMDSQGIALTCGDNVLQLGASGISVNGKPLPL